MARMHSRARGRSGSKKPPIKIVPRWVKYKKDDIQNLVIKLAKEGYASTQVGLILRDQYGIPDVKVATGKTITQIMKENKLYPKIPEDMLNLLKKAVSLRKHLERNKADKHSKRGLQNLESKIRRLGKYYVREGVLPKDWTYKPEEAKLIIQQK